MKLSSLLAIGGGIAGLVAGGDTASQIASGAAIVSGVAGATGNSNLAKIAGVAALGSEAYSLFGGGDSSSSALTPSTSSTPTGIDGALSGDRGNTAIADATSGNAGGPSGTGQSFSDARAASQNGTDYNGGLPGASNTPTADSGMSTSVASTAASSAQPIVNTNTTPSLFDSATGAAKGVGNFISQNKELVNLGGGALNSMFGPQAKQISLLQARQKMQQDEINREVANSNNLTGLSLGVATNPTGVVKRNPVT